MTVCKHPTVYECAHCTEMRCMTCDEPAWAADVKTAVRWCPEHRKAGARGLLDGTRVVVPPHVDNTGGDCRSVPAETIEWLVKHDCCQLCNELGKEGCNCKAIYEAMGGGNTEHGHHVDCVAQNVLMKAWARTEHLGSFENRS